MKKLLRCMVILLGLGLALSGCSTDKDSVLNNVKEGKKAFLKITFPDSNFSASTRATLPQPTWSSQKATTHDKELKSIQLFVFKDDGTLDQHATITRTTALGVSPALYDVTTKDGSSRHKVNISAELDIPVTTGKRIVYAVANPSATSQSALAKVKEMADLLAITPTIENIDQDKALLMSGETVVDIDPDWVGGTEVAIQLERNVARIHVAWNKTDKPLTAPQAITGGTVKVKYVFVLYANPTLNIVNYETYDPSTNTIKMAIDKATPVTRLTSYWGWFTGYDHYTAVGHDHEIADGFGKEGYSKAVHPEDAGLKATGGGWNTAGVDVKTDVGNKWFYIAPNYLDIENLPRLTDEHTPVATSIVLETEFTPEVTATNPTPTPVIRYYNGQINQPQKGALGTTSHHGIWPNRSYNIAINMKAEGNISPFTVSSDTQLDVTLTVADWEEVFNQY